MVRSAPQKETPVEVQPRTPSAKGPAEWFTGDVWFDPIVRGEDPSRIRALAVHFTPGARTAWHAQTLYVTEGEGRIQARGGERVTIRAGDVVHTPPGEWHWHGAAPDRLMTHLSLTEGVAEGPETEWGEHVSEADYGG
jgi:quercetin dioxygenase-like cupin family protein